MEKINVVKDSESKMNPSTLFQLFCFCFCFLLFGAFFVRNITVYFSDTTALVSGFVPKLMKIAENVICMGDRGEGRKHKIKNKKQTNKKILDSS